MKARMTPKNLEQWLAYNGTVRHAGGTMGHLVEVQEHSEQGKPVQLKLLLMIDWEWCSGIQIPVYAVFPADECDITEETIRI